MFTLLYKKDSFSNIVIGLFLHLLGILIGRLFNNQLVQIPFTILCWFYIIKGFTRYKTKLQYPFNGVYKILFNLYIFLTLIIIIRGYTIDYNYQWISFLGMLNFHIQDQYYILPYLIPLIVFYPINRYNFNSLQRISLIISLITILLFSIFYKEILASSIRQSKGMGLEGDYSFGSFIPQFYISISFIVLLKKYINTKIFIINCIALILALIINLIAARRGSTAILSLLFIFNLYFLYKSVNAKYKLIVIFTSIILICISINYFETNTAFDFIKDRGLEDNRSNIDEALLSQMNNFELIFGKGLNGRYYYPIFEDDYLNGWRYASETGFFLLVLRGGYLYAIIYILVLLYPALKGIFYSKNILCKALGFYILLSLLELYPFGWPAFNLKFLIIWIGVRMCYSNKIRSLSDKKIKEYFFQ